MRGCNMNYFEVVSVPWTRQSRQIQQMFWMFQSMPQKVIFSLPSPRSLFLFTATFRERSTKMYELKPELRVLLPTLSPSLRHPSCSFSRGKSGIYRLLGKADGSAHIAYLPVRADQTLMQAGEQNPLKRVARSTMYTVTMCKHPFRGPP